MMTMEASSNSRDGLSLSTTTSSSLQLSIEQWELLRRLRNSHLTKLQIIRAYDELDRLDRELGNLFNSGHSHPPPPLTLPSLSSSSSTIVPSTDPVSPITINSQQISPPSSVTNNNHNHNNNNNNNKRPHSHTGNGLSSVRPSNGYHSSTNSNIRTIRNGTNETNSSHSNSYDSINQNDLEEETRELQELLGYVN